MGKAIELTTENFDEVLNSDKPVVVDFWAPWCGPCQALGPVIDELAGEVEGEVTVGKLNVDDHSTIAQNYQISSIPAVLIFSKGEVAERIVGVQAKNRYEEALAHLAT